MPHLSTHQHCEPHTDLSGAGLKFAAMWEDLRDEVTTFLSTILPQDVCSINENAVQVGTNNQVVHFTIHVYFYVP